MDRNVLEQTILRYLGKHYSGTLSTVREDGTPQASGITYVNDGLFLYFGMDPESQKKRNVDRNPNVGMAIYKITPKIIAYMDYPKFGFNRAEILDLS